MPTAIKVGYVAMSNGGQLRFPPAPGPDDREDRNWSGGPEKQRRRPLSADLGHKARDAVMDLGRAARGLYQLRSPARDSETFRSYTTNLTVSPSMHDLDNLIPTLTDKANDDTVGLGLEGVVRIPKLTYNDYTLGERGRDARDNRSRPDAPIPLQADENFFAGPSRVGRPEKERFQIERVEITLEDVESDSPLFRAALQNMEKRTVAVKRASKGLCKAADDCAAALTALDAAESQLTVGFDNISSLMMTTLGAIRENVVVRMYESEQRRRDLARKALGEHIIHPMRTLYEVCKALLGQIKTFETESKAFYAATQKWLSSRTPASNQCLDERSYSAEAIGYDRTNAKQDRLDERQHLRRLMFDLSRLKLYQSMCRLHAGEAELLVSAHALTWCQSGGSQLSSLSYMNTLRADIYAEVQVSHERMRGVRLRCQQAQVQVHDFYSSVRQDLADQSELKLDDDSNGAFITQRVASLEHSVDFITKAKAEVLESAALSASKFASEEGSESYNCQQSEQPRVTQEFGVLPPKSGAPSSAKKWQTRLRTLSFTKQATQERLESAVSPNPSVSEGRTSKSDNVRSPKCRSFSFTSSNGPPAVKRQVDDRMGGDGAPLPRREPFSPKPNGSNELLTRKKEGILWVMSKPIQGLSGGDVPRAATRAHNWRECWVVLSGSGHLSEYVNWKEAGRFDSVKPMIDLRFATVREARGVERRFTFEVVTREQRRFFQASNEEEMRIWVAAISLAIESLINGTSSVRQVEKVVRHAEMTPGLADKRNGLLSNRDFGVRQIFDGTSGQHESAAVGIRAAFSQSLTDLSTATTAKLFSRVGRDSGLRGQRNARHESKTFDQIPQGMHLTALSEGETGPDLSDDTALRGDRGGRMTSSGEDDTTVDEECIYAPQTRSTHSRGISNSTPLSGYIGRSSDHNHGMSKDWSASQVASKSNLDICTAFDRKIELMVNSNYGPASPFNSSCHTSSGFHSRNEGTTCSSASLSRIASQNGEAIADESIVTSKHYAEGSNRYSRAREILMLASEDENRSCADCRAPNPKWASWCLNGDRVCIFICITCSGVHRSLGVQVSKVRSVDLDDWTDEQLAAARMWGNLRANAMYEHRKPDVCTVESMGGTRTKAFWAAKYVDRLWYEVEGSTLRTIDQGQGSKGSRRERPCSYAGSTKEVASAPLQSSKMSNRMSTPCVITTGF